MPASLSLRSVNSTNVRFMFETLVRRAAMRASAALTPDFAGAWAERLFLTPPKPAYPESSFLDLIDARQSFVPYRGRLISSWRWGPRSVDEERPAVLLAHGWGGNAAQLRGFVSHLAGAGFRVIAYDQPAHGLSEGRLTSLPDFAGALRAVALHHEGVRAIVGHSLGATAAAYAISQGLPIERIVMVSPPADIVAYSRRFARWYSMPERVRSAMQAAIEERYGVSWAELDVAHLAPRLSADALVVHDKGDRMVPWSQGEKFARLWPGARLLSTEGLGHNRILQSEPVWRAAADFIARRSAVSNVALPALPAPAPAPAQVY